MGGWAQSHVSIRTWTNDLCQGASAETTSDGCYPSTHPYVDGDENRSDVGCGYEGDNDTPMAYYKYECDVHYTEVIDLRMSTDDEKGTGNNVDINIFVVVLGIVCFVGMIIGYLIPRNRKVSAENMLLIDSKHANELSA